MKTAPDCVSIEEIRACIDEIDNGIIDALARRADYVTAASKFKKTISEVRAEDRIKAMLKTRGDWAQQKGLNPNFIEDLFGTIVNYFVGRESSEWSKTPPPR